GLRRTRTGSLRRAVRQRTHVRPAQKSVRPEVGQRRGEPELRPTLPGRSEGCIVALKPGNAEARRSRWSEGGPWAKRTAGGKHEPSLDLGHHVPRTCAGSGTSETGTRRPVPLVGSSDR